MTNSVDKVLLPFLTSANQEESEYILTDLLAQRIQPVIEKTLRGKLRASLRHDDLSNLNQEALELASEIKLKLLAEIGRSKSNAFGIVIQDLDSYVKTVSKNAYHQYLRRKYPNRLRLKNQLRYILTHRAGFALWESKKCGWVCGLSKWQNRSSVASKADLSDENCTALSESLVGQNDLDERLALVNSVVILIDHFHKPVIFEDFVSMIGKLLRITEPAEVELTDDIARKKFAKADEIQLRLEQKNLLGKFWEAIAGLPLRHRTVILLNLKDSRGENLIAHLPLMKIATIRQIAEILGLSAEEFARIWSELPWDDLRIASHLDISRQQVINLRQSARAALSRFLKEFKN